MLFFQQVNKCVLCTPGKGLQRGALITLEEGDRVIIWVTGQMAIWELQRGLRGYHAGLVLEQVYETLGFQFPTHPADEGLDQGISHDWAALSPSNLERAGEWSKGDHISHVGVRDLAEVNDLASPIPCFHGSHQRPGPGPSHPPAPLLLLGQGSLVGSVED